MVLKPGGLEAIKKSGPRPVCKIPYGLEDQYETLLTKLYEDLDPIDGKDLITASQIVPVIVNKNGERCLKRLAINYKQIPVNDLKVEKVQSPESSVFKSSINFRVQKSNDSQRINSPVSGVHQVT